MERPILFSGPMVRAILDGEKTQTRRVVKGTALEWLAPSMFTPAFVAARENGLSPYGAVGDRLWVRETWGTPDADHPLAVGGRKPTSGDRMLYRANEADDYQWGLGKQSQGGFVWRPSIFMPRWASRITLEITDVRVERLTDISEEDARAEGCPLTHDGKHYDPPASDPWQGYGRASFCLLWDKINAKRAPWDSNPWVWVVTFQRLPLSEPGV